MKVLAINTYAGSLLLGAHSLKAQVVASLEDVGFGQDVAEANFPLIPHKKTVGDWPQIDLENTHVIAHPPCAPFSNQASARKGTRSEAFKCHVRVMEYAMSHGCESLSIESVPGALEGARKVHDKYAQRYGYNVFRILQNAISFGLPQWRPRFWVIFSKDKELDISFTPNYRSLDQVLRTHTSEYVSPFVKKQWDYIDKKVGGKLDEYVLDESPPGSFKTSLDAQYGEEMTERIMQQVKGVFQVKLPRVLHPHQFAPTILADSLWLFHGRLLTTTDYCRIMGFPDNYDWCGKDARLYLSKGVCPPVAAWILIQVGKMQVPRAAYTVRPGETLDLQPKKSAVVETLEVMSKMNTRRFK